MSETIADTASRPARHFDEAAFDAAVARPNGWDAVADPVAEIRRMRGDAPPGNAAAMREALVIVKRLFDGRIMFQPAIRKAHEAVNTALAAPALNLDRFTDTWDAQRAFMKEYRDAYGHPAPSSEDSEYWPKFVFWLFDKAEARDE